MKVEKQLCQKDTMEARGFEPLTFKFPLACVPTNDKQVAVLLADDKRVLGGGGPNTPQAVPQHGV